MSYLDQEQPIDYTSKYNENIGTISPRSRHHNKMDNSHLTSYHSNNLYTSSKTDNSDSFNRSAFVHSQFTNQPALSNNTNVDYGNTVYSNNVSNQENNNYQMNQSSNHSNKNLSQDCLESGNFTYLYEDTTDSYIVYNTENTPICFSNDSPPSSLSLECLNAPIFSSASTNLNRNVQESELNSSGDSMLDYNMEGTPICFSHDSPMSPLSMNYDEEALSPPSPGFINRHINNARNNRNNDPEITSLLSNMSINHTPSTRSSNDRLDKKSESKFGQLSNDEDVQSSDGFCMLNYDRQQSNNESNGQMSPKFLNQSSTVNQSNNQINDQPMDQERLSSRTSSRNDEQIDDQEEDDNAVDFEDGFEDYANEEFYLNKCINFGRLPNNLNSNSNQFQQDIQQQPQQLQNNVHRFTNHTNISQMVRQENVINHKPPSHLITFDKKESRHEHFTFNRQLITHPPPQQSQPQLPPPPPQQQQQHCPKSIKKIGQSDETATTITDFSTKFVSRSQYKIDGEEQRQTGSMVFGPVYVPPQSSSYYRRTVTPDRLPENRQVQNSNAGPVEKQRCFKNIFGMLKKKN